MYDYRYALISYSFIIHSESVYKYNVFYVVLCDGIGPILRKDDSCDRPLAIYDFKGLSSDRT